MQRFRDRDHVRFVAKQPCMICGRQPSDAHHVRFAQSPALGRRVSDEFTVPLLDVGGGGAARRQELDGELRCCLR